MVNKGPGVYIITNTASDKKYVGSSTNVHRRLIDHKNKLNRRRHPNNHLQAAYNEAKEHFRFELYKSTDTREEALILEQHLLDLWDLTKVGYNRSATAVSRLPDLITRTYVITEEHRKNLCGPRPTFKGSNHHATKPIFIYDTITNIYLGCWLGGAMQLSKILGKQDSYVGHFIYTGRKTNSDGLYFSYAPIEMKEENNYG